MNTLSKLKTILNEIQSCDAKKFSDSLKEALKLIPIDNSFLRIIDIVLISEKNTLPPKVSHFIGRILEEQSQTNKMIFTSILIYISDKISCKNTKIRRNSLKMIGLMLSIDHRYATAELIEKIAERLFDKEQSVRKEALKICIPFQTKLLSDSVSIQTTIKDMIRYDQSHEIRRIGFMNLELTNKTLNCILERCIDHSLLIRKAFWIQYFNKIDIKKLDLCQRIYLMKKAMNEREFDAKEIFLQKIREIGIKDFIEYFYSEDEEYENCLSVLLAENTMEFYLDNYTPSYLNFLVFYYKIKEERDGRDSLKLIDLKEFLEIFHFKCKEIEESNSKIDESQFKVLKYLLKILLFYDIFTDESKKFVYSIINHLIVHPMFTKLIEDCIYIIIKISNEKAINFIGNLIKKTKGQPVCFLISEFAMKHLEYGDFFDAVLSEVIAFNIESSYNILFWYLMKNYKSEIADQYLNFLPNKKVLEGAVDLVLSDIMTVDRIEECLFMQLAKFNISAVIPTCKLLLIKKITNPDYLKNLLIVYYSTDSEFIQQYLALFFFEYFRISTLPLIDVFCSVLELITSNYKVFVDQSIFWISQDQNGLQLLYFTICAFIINNYDSLVNKKYFFSTLFKINVTDKWEPILTKKIIFVLGLIIRKRPRENATALLNQLIEIDDGTPLSNEDFEDVKGVIRF